LVEQGPVKYLLGVEVLIDMHKKTVFFGQEAYIKEVLKRFGMQQPWGANTGSSIKCSAEET
jgi:hypothetical protein